MAHQVKNLPAMQEMWVLYLDQEDPLEKGMATYASILAGKIPWAEELGRLWSMGAQKVGHDWSDWAQTHTHTLTTLISLEEMMLKLKLLYFGHLMGRVDSLEKTLILEGLGAREEEDDRGWDGWMALLTWWTWVWVNSGSWWWTGRPGVLRFMGSQRVGHDWATELNWTDILAFFVKDKLSIGAWIYLWGFYFVPLIYISVFVPVPYCLDDCSFIVSW